MGTRPQARPAGLAERAAMDRADRARQREASEESGLLRKAPAKKAAAVKPMKK
jgi:hypothetical protein